MDTKQRFENFVLNNKYLDVVAIAELTGLHFNVITRWMNGHNSEYTESVVKRFLDDDGNRIQEITEKLKSGSRNRIDLHVERALIFKKARDTRRQNQRVPSLSNLTI